MEGPVAGLAGLFVSAFTSATLLPGTSEALLTAMAFWRHRTTLGSLNRQIQAPGDRTT